MKSVFNVIRHGAPLFLYSASLFILVNFFGKLSNSVAALLSFLLFAFLLIFLMYGKNSLQEKYYNNGKATDSAAVIAELFSLCIETGIITRVFNSVSDAESSTFDNCAFALFIILICFLVSSAGKNTVLKISNILFIIPFLAVIPCLASSFQNGILTSVISDFQRADPIYEFFGGFILAFIFIPDVKIISDMQKKTGTFNKGSALKGITSATLYSVLFSVFLRMLLGNNIYESVRAPVFSAAGTVNVLEFDEIILIIYSLCLLFRFSCKLSFIGSFFEKYTSKKSSRIILTLLTASLCAIIGVPITENFGSFTSRAAIYGITNLTAFILIPLLSILFRKAK